MYTFLFLYWPSLEEPTCNHNTMRNILLLTIAVFGFGLVHAQDCTGADHTVLAGSYYYSPSTLTVTAGETIAFLNEAGFHDVNGVSSSLGATWSNPETFSLPANSGSTGGVCMGTITLNTPGTYEYDCSIGSHASLGMVGTIIVEEAAPATVDVTFSVDMQNAGLLGGEAIYVSGSMDGWCGSCIPLSDADGDDVYSAVVPLAPNADYEYKFLINGWGGDEMNILGTACDFLPGDDFGNRGFSLGSTDLVLPTPCFDSCDPCVPTSSGAGCTDSDAVNYDATATEDDGSCQYEVTFQVDMSQSGIGAADSAYVNGEFNGWCGACNVMSDTDGDQVWTLTLPFGVGAQEYKFTINGWDIAESVGVGASCDWNPADSFDNRGFEVVDSPIVLDVVCFNSCTACSTGGDIEGCTDANATNYNSLATIDNGSCQYNITFRVDMAGYGGTYGTVNINSNWNGWCGGCNPMDDADSDGIYEVTIPLALDTFEYKFTVDGWTDQEYLTEGDPCTSTIDGYTNRSIVVTGTETLAAVCWESCDACAGGGGDVNVTFSVDMQNAGLLGGEAIYVSGSMDGWCGSCIPLSDADGDDVYSAVVPLAPNADYEYKFLINGWGGDEMNILGTACDFLPGDDFGNRGFSLGSTDLVLPTPCFDSCDPCVPTSSGAGCTDSDAVNYDATATEDDGSCQYEVTFQVDMSQSGIGAADSAYVNGEFNGWCGACNVMSDTDGDQVWTLTLPFGVGAQEYKFTINGWDIAESVGVGASCDWNPADSFDNRGFEVVDSPIVLDVVCFNSCTACSTGGDIEGCTDANATNYNSLATIDNGSCQYNITFRVDMAGYGGTYGTVNINSNWNGWCGGCNPMDDADSDGIYEVTIPLALDTFEYKFTVDGWTDQEYLTEGDPCTSTIDGYTNRSIVVTGTETLAAVCWESCDACDGGGTGGDVLTATLDVSCSGLADITSVRIFGPWWGWDPNGGPEASDNGDGSWSVVFDPIPTDNMEYKWLINGEQEDLLDFGPDLNDDGYDDYLNDACAPITDYFSYANRLWNAGSGDIMDTWGTCEPCAVPDSVLVTITVDMSEEDVNPIGVFVAGNFQGWSPGTTIGTDNGDGTWSHSFYAAPGSDVQYKWLNGTAWGFEEVVPSDCQYPGDSNRGFDVPNADYNHPVHCFGSCNPCGAATYPVTLTVLTDNITVAGDGMHWAGAPNGWSGEPMSDNGDGSWSVTVDAEAGSFEFKFQNGNGGWEELDCGGNRSVTVDGSGPVSYTGCFAQCGETTECATDPDPANVTFRVDMSEVDSLQADSVYLIGSFTDPVWQAGGILMSDSDGDLIYEATVLISGPAGIAYKFYNGNPYPNGAGTDEGGETADFAAGGCGVDNGVGGFNRTHDRSGADETLDVVCFNSCSACGPAGTPVTFAVDMNSYGGTFGFVNVSGSWNGFCADCNQLTDEDNDGIWTATFNIPEGENQGYKYQVDSWADQEDLAPGNDQVGPCVITAGGFTNRDLDVVGTDPIDLGVVCWGSCLACGDGGTPGCTDATAANYDGAATYNDGTCLYDVTFNVNMSQYALADGDSVYVNANFNGWCGACNPMLDGDGDGVYSTTIQLAYDYYEYKFTVNAWSAEENLAGIGTCVTENYGFTNRVLQVFANQSEPVVCWNSCSDCEGNDILGCTDPAASNYAEAANSDDGSCQYPVTFKVDMAGYGGTYGMVNLNGSFAGWCGSCIEMTDADSDGVYEVTVDLGLGTIEYKFTVDGWTDQEFFDPSDPCTSTIDGYTNRTIDVAGAATLDVVCWESCYTCDAPVGCTDDGAQNYDDTALIDDGSCAYMVTIRVDMSTQEVAPEGVHIAGAFTSWNPGSTPMSTPGLGLYTYTLQLANGSYQYLFINGNDWPGQETVPAECGADNGLGGFNRLVTVAGADMTLDVVCFNSCEACAGCTDPLSAEFSPFAGSDDGSCATPLVFGCTYPDADNYDATATNEDGSCIFSGASDCPTDIDGDGSTAVGDLLIILGAFGQACE